MRNKKWADIPGYEGLYRITRKGLIMSYEKKWFTGRGNGRLHTQPAAVLKQNISKFGYYRVPLWKNGKSKKFHTHTLVAKCFCKNWFEKAQVNHKDGIKTNNYYKNLEWVSASQNMQHAFDTGLHFINQKTKDAVKKHSSGAGNTKAKAVIDNITGKKFDTIKQAADFYGLSVWSLYGYLRGLNKVNPTSLCYAGK